MPNVSALDKAAWTVRSAIPTPVAKVLTEGSQRPVLIFRWSAKRVRTIFWAAVSCWFASTSCSHRNLSAWVIAMARCPSCCAIGEIRQKDEPPELRTDSGLEGANLALDGLIAQSLPV